MGSLASTGYALPSIFYLSWRCAWNSSRSCNYGSSLLDLKLGLGVFLLVNFLRDVIFLNWLVLKFRYLLRLRMGYFLLFDLGGPEIQIHGIVILRVTHLPAFVWGVAILDLLLHQLLLYLLILLLLSELLLKLFEYLILLKLPSLFDNKITLKRWQVWANL